jgi:hypothetical protein
MKIALVCAMAFLVFLGAAAADEPAGGERPTEQAIERSKQLRSGVANFKLTLHFFGPQRKPFYNLTLSVPPVPQAAAEPFHPIVQIDEKEAEKIIQALVVDGFLDRAENDGAEDITLRAPKGPTYVLTIVAESPQFGRLSFHEDLGWKLAMLTRLDALKPALGDKSQAALDVLLTRLSGLRRQWQSAQD